MDAVKFPEMDPAEFAAKLARYNARERGPKLSLRAKGKPLGTFGRMNAARFDEELARRRKGVANQWQTARETAKPKERAE